MEKRVRTNSIPDLLPQLQTLTQARTPRALWPSHNSHLISSHLQMTPPLHRTPPHPHTTHTHTHTHTHIYTPHTHTHTPDTHTHTYTPHTHTLTHTPDTD